MKKLFVAIAFIPSVAFAGACDTVAEYARNSMAARQSGVPLPKLMKKINENEAKTDVEIAAVKIMKYVLLRAYDQPRFHGKEYTERSITDFESEIYIECEKAKQ